MDAGRIERLLKLIESLQVGRARTAKELAKITGVSRRTVFRDLGLLTRAGVACSFDRSAGAYRIDRDVLLPPVAFSHAEALALLLLIRGGLAQPFVCDRDVAQSAALKVEGMLPPLVQDHCRAVLATTEIRPDPASDPASARQKLANLQSALAGRRKVQVQYNSYLDQCVLDLVLHPYRVAYIHRGWYLLAYSEATSDIRNFKVERILKIKVLTSTYRIDPTFSLDGFFGNAWLMIREDESFHVKIKFTKTVAANVDEIAWHKTQRTTYYDDGSLLFEADVDGVKEISWWVLGYGDQAEVLEPPELRNILIGHAKQMCAQYNGAAQEQG
ncbi:MAG: transcriptional regulator [Planctomycetes bacterium]|nr:transcriptional regulator [Planctomycetota bacterium]